MRVSRSGAVRSAMRPHSNRLRSRSSRVRIAFGGRSERQDDLLAVLVDRVERVEELLLGPLLVRDELDVVDEEQVDPAVAGAELVDLALLDRGDELVGELLARRVDDALARELGDDLVADGVHQVGLAEAHAAVQEERVVGVAGPLGDGQAGRVGEPVGRADDEVRERVARVEVGRRRPRRRPGSARAGPAGAGDGGRVPRPARPRFAGAAPATADDELDLDAVADDPGERLADQRAVAGLEPVLGEAVGTAIRNRCSSTSTSWVSRSHVS